VDLPENYFVSIGLWGRLKNIKIGLKSFNTFLRNYDYKDIYYILIGPGLGTNDESYKWAKKNKLDKNVLFLGKRSREETLKILKGAKALLHPSKTEAFPMVLGEAMYLNVPVIGGIKSGGVPELLGNGDYGLLCDISSVKEIVTKLYFVLNNSENINSIINLAKKRTEKYGKLLVTKMYLDVYNLIYKNIY
jgi:glycosyltransferase involved in cell wall biosynthesis